MRIIGILAGVTALAGSLASEPAGAVELVGPQDLKANWLDGRTVSTTGPRGGASTFAFAADGKVTRAGGRAGSATEGTWRVDDEGFCMKLGQARRESCYLAIKADDGSLKVVRRQGAAFVWRR
ncbi:hypothetical protein JOD31_002141 [Methylopila capsulata]|uniref:Uncharacterized protein n=1 Tax=Methylopila capsulata TaxID=61654 RepID=A0A9W6ITU8_9HYPH|nr:hypothetical protein [Methylopila capsulata]MBM7851916.1 hypothetical protein [Methylopila capsulata]GLK54981.1 hypothetical protein GCM10008170_10000 [Methylopila capsulata]